MKQSLLLLLFAINFSARAQIYHDRIGFDLESISHIDFGWMRTYNPTTPPQAKQLGDRKYSAVQIGYCQQFIQWMQQSYRPKGCLGNAGYYQNAISKFSSTNSRLGNEINTHLTALPHLYGSFTKMYMFLKKDEAGKFVPQNNFAEFWHIEANGIEHISMPVSFISSPEEYYFVLPDFVSNPKGYNDDDKPASVFMGFATHSNLAPYKHFYIPPKTVDDYPHYVVMMTKDNTLPFEEVTIGEFFSLVEKQFPVWQSIDPIPAEPYATAKKNLARLKDKYSGRMNEIAKLQLSATQINLWNFVNATPEHEDFFDNKDSNGKPDVLTTFPIMKVKKSAKELSKTDTPQWLVVRWTMGMPNEKFNIHMHQSIMNNFNFGYLYNFFYRPEKVKGQAYKPLINPFN